jgi:hypothetical protein
MKPSHKELSAVEAKEDWGVIRHFLPKDWEEQARLLGALTRARGVVGAEELLRILLIHLASGCSLAETAVRAKRAGLGEISAVALFKRLKSAESWLRWLAEQTRGISRVPVLAHGRRLRVVDATSVSEPGSTGTDWKLHYAVNLGDLQCDFFELTAVGNGGETFRRVPVRAKDIMLGDRIYATPPGVAHVVDSGGDVLVRLNRQTLPLFDSKRERMDVLRLLRGIKRGRPYQWKVRVQHPKSGWMNGRLIAIKLSAEAARLARRRLARRANRRQQGVSKRSLQAAQYLMIWTSLPDVFDAATILEIYRLRWQIELVFKRMKSIMGLGHLPKTDPNSSRAWLHGKLFVALLVERMIEAAKSFSPWGYPLDVSPQPVEGS